MITTRLAAPLRTFVFTVTLAALPSVATAADITLRLVGASSTVELPTALEHIPAEAVSFDVRRADDALAPHVHEISLEREPDGASPLLFACGARGTRFTEAYVVVDDPDSAHPQMTIGLRGVEVAAYAFEAGPTGRPRERVVLSFEEISLRHAVGTPLGSYAPR